MSKPKVLIAHRPGPEIEAMLEDAPSELEICFLPAGEKLGDHISDIELLYGLSVKKIFAKAKSVALDTTTFVGVEWARFPAFMDSDVSLSQRITVRSSDSPNTHFGAPALADRARHL